MSPRLTAPKKEDVPFGDDELVRAIQSFSGGTFPGVVQAGEVLRGGDVRVKAAPGYFVRDSVPFGEQPTPWSFLPDPPQDSGFAISVSTIEPHEAAWCVWSLRTRTRNFMEGTRYRRDDPDVRKHAQHFEIRQPLTEWLEQNSPEEASRDGKG